MHSDRCSAPHWVARCLYSKQLF